MKLRFRSKLILLVLVILTIPAVSFVLVLLNLSDNIEADTIEQLANSNQTYEEFNRLTFDQLIQQAISVSDNPKFAATLSTNDAETVKHGLLEFNANLELDIFMALNSAGQIIASVDPDQEAFRNLSAIAEVSGALAGFDNGGFWENKGRIFRIAAVPTIVAGQILGALIMGKAVSDADAATIAKVTASNIGFLLHK